ncbi:MAG: LysM peptidoglycan-binding domain-containing protein [Actinobacteria bacterium]|nr:LysM peptidoglycan-binding domain-containing protein [Actinomycetota bacterium]
MARYLCPNTNGKMTTGPDNPIRLGKMNLPKIGDASREAMASADLSVIHMVTKGQNLAQIARVYELTIEDIRRVNGLSEQSLIFPGQKLVISIPAEEILEDKQQSEHVVALGESIFAIAARFGLSVTQLQKINNLSDNAILFPGTKLKLVAEASLENSERLTRFARLQPTQCLVHGYHAVKHGDKPSRIAAFHGVSTQALLSANGLSWNVALGEGQKLIVPISHGPLNCPSLVRLNPSAFGSAQNYVRFAEELNASDYVIVNALCLEMQRSGLVPESGLLATAKELFQKLTLVRGIETLNVREALASAGFEELASGAALWEPSAWSWLNEIRRSTDA